MAQTKTKSAGRKTPAKKNSAAARSGSARSTAKDRTASAQGGRSSGSNSKSQKRRSRNPSSRSRARSTASRSNGSGRIGSARHAVAETTKSAGETIASNASRAKGPAVASGMAIAGLAGGIALGARGRSRRKLMGMPVPRRSVLKASTKNLASSAKNVGSFAEQLAELTTEVKRTRETLQADGRGRSPIEVLLRGLTNRPGR